VNRFGKAGALIQGELRLFAVAILFLRKFQNKTCSKGKIRLFGATTDVNVKLKGRSTI
jgi:hypothetical protein